MENVGENQKRTNIGPVLIKKDQDWSFLRFSLTFFNIFIWNFEHSFATELTYGAGGTSSLKQLSCEAKLKVSSKNIEKYKIKSKKGLILVLSWLVLSCLIFVTVTVALSWRYTGDWRELIHNLGITNIHKLINKQKYSN